MPGIDQSLQALAQVNNIGFAEFTNKLVSGVFQSVISASIDQMKAYASLVEQVSKSTEQFINDTIGADSVARNVTADLFIKDNLAIDLPVDAPASTTLSITPPQFENLTTTFTGFKVDGKSIDDPANMKAPAGTPSITSIKLPVLRSFVIAQLERSASESHNLLITMMKIGMQKVVVTKGHIKTKLTFDVAARERSSESSFAKHLDKSKKIAAGGRVSTATGLSGIFGVQKLVSDSLNAGAGLAAAGEGAIEDSTILNVSVVSSKNSAATNLNAEIIGEVLIEFSTETFPSV